MRAGREDRPGGQPVSGLGSPGGRPTVGVPARDPRGQAGQRELCPYDQHAMEELLKGVPGWTRPADKKDEVFVFNVGRTGAEALPKTLEGCDFVSSIYADPRNHRRERRAF